MELLNDLLMRSSTISVTADKTVGELVHTIGGRVVMETSGLSPGKFVNIFTRLRDPDGVRWDW